MIGFRNTLVHGYIDIDRTIVHDVLKNGRKDIAELNRLFAGFLSPTDFACILRFFRIMPSP